MATTRLIPAIFCILLLSSVFVLSEAFNSNHRIGKRAFKVKTRTVPDLCQFAFEHCGDSDSLQRLRDADTDYVWSNKRNDEYLHQ
ncbi:hypothetical protein ACROYT_G011308 [Oculina patagonica]